MERSRAYVFTLNNYTEEDEKYLQEVLQCRYIIYGRETAPETGTPHLQGYVYFNSARPFNAVRKLRKWHIEKAKGDALQNGEYVKKTMIGLKKAIVQQLKKRKVMAKEIATNVLSTVLWRAILLLLTVIFSFVITVL